MRGGPAPITVRTPAKAMVKLWLCYGKATRELPQGVCVDELFSAIRLAVIMQNGGDEGYRQKVDAIADKYLGGAPGMKFALGATVVVPKSRYLHFYNERGRDGSWQLAVISDEALQENMRPYTLCKIVE